MINVDNGLWHLCISSADNKMQIKSYKVFDTCTSQYSNNVFSDDTERAHVVLTFFVFPSWVVNPAPPFTESLIKTLISSFKISLFDMFSPVGVSWDSATF